MAGVEHASARNQTTLFRMLPVVEQIEGAYSENGLRVSEAAYWEIYYHDPDFTYEWNHGILEEKPKAPYGSFRLYQWFFLLLQAYLRARPIAKPIGLHIGFRLALPKKTTVRRPDLAVILNANPVGIADEDCVYKGVFDLCIELLSDATLQDVERDTLVKKAEYCQAGVTEYFILDWKGNETAFYRLTKASTYAPIPQPGGIICSEVLPGFQFRLADLYEQPDDWERRTDPVYNPSLVMADQAERQRAEAERQERLRLAAMLKDLGIDPGQSHTDS